MDMQFLNSRRRLSQGLLFWREIGEGTPIIFLHGAWNDSSEWVSVMELLSQKFHCFAPDLLGFGESDFPDFSNSIDLQVESLTEFFQALRLARVDLVGHSLGGWVAASYALKYPEKINNLILLAPLGVETEGLDKEWQKMERLKNGLFYTKFWRPLRPLAKTLGLDGMEINWRQKDILEAYSTATELLYQRQLSEIKSELLQERLDLIVIPTLIIQGEKDSNEALERSKIYARKIGNAKLTMMAAGDNLPVSNSSDVGREIRDFLRIV